MRSTTGCCPGPGPADASSESSSGTTKNRRLRTCGCSVRDRGVGGSNPLAPTNSFKMLENLQSSVWPFSRSESAESALSNRVPDASNYQSSRNRSGFLRSAVAIGGSRGVICFKPLRPVLDDATMNRWPGSRASLLRRVDVPAFRFQVFMVSTMRNRALPCIMRAYASAACSSGTVSIIGRTFARTLKARVSSLSMGVPVSAP